MKFGNLKISQKLPLLITCLAVLSAGITGFITISKASKAGMSATEDKLIALQASRVGALNNYM